VADVAKKLAEKPGDAGRARFGLENDKLGKVEKELEQLNKDLDASAKADPKDRAAGEKAAEKADEKAKREVAERLLRSVQEAKQNLTNYEQARKFYANGQFRDAQLGQVGVDVAVCANTLRTQDRLTQTANRLVQGRNCLEVGGLWIDEGFTAAMKTLVVKAQSDAYFKILEKKPEMKDVFRLGNHLVFVTPSQTALVIDTTDGKDKLTDDEVAALFVAKK
jgi:Ca-activated chloride channel family protein